MARVLPAEGAWAGRLAWLALALSVGAVLAALIGAVGSAQEAWHFRVGFAVLRYSFFIAIAGGVLAVAAILLMRDRPRPRRRWAIVLALLFGFGFAGYVGKQYVTARTLPAIHDISTDLEDLPEFRALPVRADNLENVPVEGRPALAAMEPEERWKALHREAYGDLEPISVPWSVRETIGRAQTVAEKNGWEIVHFDPARGTLEATDTTLFFRFKDDVVIRARPDPERKGRTLVDMRSISRIGGSDVGTNARRIREYLKDLRQS
ncbi:MAG TPA: DUF1499 domain-containing protein [Allosphingosinicella sp.]|jgi:uncharacterized protein (DUF1499 family)|uniref:DUF1499 domain-containing protein n=1 Tax=Allosphingosinicella sp. TaxID=2823234 RepID=UPI002F2A78EC